MRYLTVILCLFAFPAFAADVTFRAANETAFRAAFTQGAAMSFSRAPVFVDEQGTTRLSSKFECVGEHDFADITEYYLYPGKPGIYYLVRMSDACLKALVDASNPVGTLPGGVTILGATGVTDPDLDPDGDGIYEKPPGHDAAHPTVHMRFS